MKKMKIKVKRRNSIIKDQAERLKEGEKTKINLINPTRMCKFHNKSMHQQSNMIFKVKKSTSKLFRYTFILANHILRTHFAVNSN